MTPLPMLQVQSISDNLRHVGGSADKDALFVLGMEMDRRDYDNAVSALLKIKAITEHNKILHLEV